MNRSLLLIGRLRRGRVLPGLAGLAVTATALTGCSGGDSATGSSTPSAVAAGPSTTPKRAPTTSAPPTTSTLGAFPPVLSTSPSPIDSAAIRGVSDLPTAFQCAAAVQPITIPPSGDLPASVVCASKVAGDETIYLWYAGTPDERYLALKAALAKAKYVHGGPNWVAGGMLAPAMGTVGGEVYK